VSLTRRRASCNRRPESINTIPSSFFFFTGNRFRSRPDRRAFVLPFACWRCSRRRQRPVTRRQIWHYDRLDLSVLSADLSTCRSDLLPTSRRWLQLRIDFNSTAVQRLCDRSTTHITTEWRYRYSLIITVIIFFTSVGMIPREFKIRRAYKSGYDHQTVQSMTGNKTALKRGTEQRWNKKKLVSSLPWDLSNPPTKYRHELTGWRAENAQSLGRSWFVNIAMFNVPVFLSSELCRCTGLTGGSTIILLIIKFMFVLHESSDCIVGDYL